MAHFFSTTTPVCNKRPTTDPIAIHTPSGAILHSTHEADLNKKNQIRLIVLSLSGVLDAQKTHTVSD